VNGTAGALVLSYYLTAAADLHYAIVPHGHDALKADEIKAAAIGNASAFGAVDAATHVAMQAQRLSWTVRSLGLNTTYDVYFVAEVRNSN
jgi:hypothetical protein